ncbi:hypothetical protein [Cupriavidus plantarum]|uniref:hypothetical protein n=1 Tax=Cupriavidus plantarum TaxID=942865 RepID=UPI0015C902D5|nr:hypothetical protein [Cupriavidus plantarum]NYI00083.1 hypothetical protein [Cupriavidus plantarum]
MRWRVPWRASWRASWASWPAAASLLALSPLRAVLEGSMALQMLVLLPAVFALGYTLPRMLPSRARGRLAAAMRPAALSLLIVATVGYAAWMLPIAIDLTRLHASVNLAKYATVTVAGTAAYFAGRVSPWPLVLFFGGNMVWMGLTVGMLFLDAETRLCASYLLGDQRVAGAGLIAWSAALGGWLLAWVGRRANRSGRPKELQQSAVNASDVGSH